MKQIIVYGSLKKGKHNHRILESSKFLGDTVVQGTLYRVSSYPALIEEGSNKYPAEIYEVSDDIYNGITRMEIGAGYKVVSTELGDIYYADERLAKMCKEHLEEIEVY